MSALMGDPDLYLWVFQFQNAIIGSVWVSATSQKLVGSQVLILNRNKVDYCKYKWLKQINTVEALSSLT